MEGVLHTAPPTLSTSAAGDSLDAAMIIVTVDQVLIPHLAVGH